MYYEIKFDFQTAARKRAARDQSRSACLHEAKRPLRGSNSSVARTSRTLPKLGRGSPFTIGKSQVTSHPVLIETPRLEFPATLTKQRLHLTSNRDKIAVFSSELPLDDRNRQEPSSLEFLIANLELEFFLNIVKSTKYKFLIANKRGFRVRRGGSRFCASESLFAGRNLSSENRTTILAGGLKTIIGAIRRTLVKVKSLLCYGDSHFQLCKMITNSPNVRLGEN
jgi:hypothetical protein